MPSLPRAALLLGLLAMPVAAQEDREGGWNDTRVVELVERARAARSAVTADSVLTSYKADARGFVYFFIDRPDSEERTLVKADQVALEVYWRSPSDTKQRIVGLRDEKVLPTNIKYHLDHLTVVQDEFDDLIRLGDGDEVAAVVHPVAPGSSAVYDFRLADSLTIGFGGTREPVRVYEIEVRPQDLARPGFVGSVFVDRATAAIVRMSFTFTPASYVDPHLDYIRISLDNSLWMDRYWLPYRQEAELRRELPQLDFLAGSIIRGRFEIGGYVFNEPLADALFRTRAVTAVPEDERRAFPFERPLFDDLETEGLAPSPSMDAIQAQVRRLVGARTLSGLRRLRLHVPSASDAVRYGRAEGLFLGAGLAFRPHRDFALKVHGGWGFGREALSASVRVSPGAEGGPLTVAAYLDELRDIGPRAGASRIVNSIATLGGDDYTDPYFASGATVQRRWGPVSAAHLRTAVRVERHESGRRVVGDSLTALRPVRPVTEGWLRALDVEGVRPAPNGNGVDAFVAWRVADLEGTAYGSARGGLGWGRAGAWRATDVRADIEAGWAHDDAPLQELFLMGGRGTVPGHPYRAQVGDRYWLATASLGWDAVAPWLGMHVFASAGRAWSSDPRPLPADWGGDQDEGTLTSAGFGVDLLWDVVRVDLARGFGDRGDWELVLAVSHRFHPWL